MKTTHTKFIGFFLSLCLVAGIAAGASAGQTTTDDMEAVIAQAQKAFAAADQIEDTAQKMAAMREIAVTLREHGRVEEAAGILSQALFNAHQMQASPEKAVFFADIASEFYVEAWWAWFLFYTRRSFFSSISGQ